VFLAVGSVDGPEVQSKAKERPLKLDEALCIAIQAAEELREAHQNSTSWRSAIIRGRLLLASEFELGGLALPLPLTGGLAAEFVSL